MTYEMQGEWQVVSDRLTHLNTTIRKDALTTLEESETIDELDFLFPELTRIHDHDLVSIEAWKDRIDWSKALPEDEIKQLKAFVNDEGIESEDFALIDDNEPAEYAFYENAKSNFVPDALRGSLVYSFDIEARRKGEEYIAERAMLESLTAFNSQNLRQASPLSVANLAMYFAEKDESLGEEAEEDRAVAVTA